MKFNMPSQVGTGTAKSCDCPDCPILTGTGTLPGTGDFNGRCGLCGSCDTNGPFARMCWEVLLDGVQNDQCNNDDCCGDLFGGVPGNCDECTDWNGTHILKYYRTLPNPGTCEWLTCIYPPKCGQRLFSYDTSYLWLTYQQERPVGTGDCDTWDNVWTLRFTNWMLGEFGCPYRDTINFAFYEHLGGIDCNGPNLFTLTSIDDTDNICKGWPPTLTMSPTSCSNYDCSVPPGGTGTGTGSINFPCHTLDCTWEFQDIREGEWVEIGNNCNFSQAAGCGCNIPPPFSPGLDFGDQITLACTTNTFPVCEELECVWEFDGADWNVLYNGCYFQSSCICGSPPSPPSPTAGDQESTFCSGAP